MKKLRKIIWTLRIVQLLTGTLLAGRRFLIAVTILLKNVSLTTHQRFIHFGNRVTRNLIFQRLFRVVVFSTSVTATWKYRFKVVFCLKSLTFVARVVHMSSMTFSSVVYLNKEVIDRRSWWLIVVSHWVSVIRCIRRWTRRWTWVRLAMTTFGPLLVGFEFNLTHYDTWMIADGACEIDTLCFGNVNFCHKFFPFLCIFIFFATSVYNPALSWNITSCNRGWLRCVWHLFS